MNNKTYYEILNIPTDATSEEIKRAYHSLCKKYHPDINPKASELFKEINTAYQTLIDPVKRREYDVSLASGASYDDADYAQYAKDFADLHAQYEKEIKLKNEPIINILDEFDDYRFEDAMGAIWNRNIFVLIGNAIYCILIMLGVLANRTAKLFKKSLLTKKYHKSPWIAGFFDAMAENTLGKFTIWSIFMSTMAFCKFIYHLFQIVFVIAKWALIIVGAFLFIGAVGSHNKH